MLRLRLSAAHKKLWASTEIEAREGEALGLLLLFLLDNRYLLPKRVWGDDQFATLDQQLFQIARFLVYFTSGFGKARQRRFRIIYGHFPEPRGSSAHRIQRFFPVHSQTLPSVKAGVRGNLALSLSLSRQRLKGRS